MINMSTNKSINLMERMGLTKPKNHRDNYKCLNESNSTYGCLRDQVKLGLYTKVTNENTLYTNRMNINEDRYEVQQERNGGMIIFSTDVNAIKQSSNKIINWFKSNFQTFINRLNHKSKIKDAVGGDVYYSIGNYLTGTYKDKEGNVFTEKSLAVEFIDIDSEKLFVIAERLCEIFQQESVLVKDYVNQRFYFVDNQDVINKNEEMKS